MEEQDNIGKLFRDRLENAEVLPSEWLRDDIMRKAGRKEFFRFNPARLNIYYISLLVLAAATAFILFTDAFRKEESKPSPGNELNQVPDTNQSVILQERLPESNSERQTNYLEKRIAATEVIDSGSRRSADDQEKRLPQETVITPPEKNIFSIRGLFSNNVEDINKLQGGSQFIDNLIEPSQQEGCAPLKIRFSCKQGSYESYQWSFGEEGSSSAKNPEWTFNAEGEYKVGLVTRRSDGSYLTSFTCITVHSRPVARFEIRQPEEGGDNNEIRFINYSLNAAKFRWYFGDGSSSESFEPGHEYSKPGSYDVMMIASSEYGCADSLIVQNDFNGYNYFVNFPNAFIPNTGGPTGGYYSTKSDESAQVFHPVFSGVAKYQLKIYSKIGILIFETNDINVGWDGYFKGQLSEPGVYIWEVRGTYVNDQPFISRGDVTLLKY